MAVDVASLYKRRDSMGRDIVHTVLAVGVLDIVLAGRNFTPKVVMFCAETNEVQVVLQFQTFFCSSARGEWDRRSMALRHGLTLSNGRYRCQKQRAGVIVMRAL